MTNHLHALLARAARQPHDGRVYVRGGWVDAMPTVPLAGGVQGLVRFADLCWRQNIRLSRQLLELESPAKGPRP